MKKSVRDAQSKATAIKDSPNTNARYAPSGDTTDLVKLGKEFEATVRENLTNPQSEIAQDAGLKSLGGNQHTSMFDED
jgi:hypothetical protein